MRKGDKFYNASVQGQCGLPEQQLQVRAQSPGGQPQDCHQVSEKRNDDIRNETNKTKTYQIETKKSVTRFQRRGMMLSEMKPITLKLNPIKIKLKLIRLSPQRTNRLQGSSRQARHSCKKTGMWVKM